MEEGDRKKREAERLLSLSVRVRRVVLLLAGLEQGAAYLAQIAFLGATVVLLGGYVSRLKPYDFKLISGLLLSEGVRVFLAPKHVEYLVTTGRRWGTVSILEWLLCASYFMCCWWCCCYPEDPSLFIHEVLHWLQVGTATVTVGFSLSRLKSGDYKPTLSSPSDAGEVANFVYGIRLFYILTLVESAVFLVVKVLAWDSFMCWFCRFPSIMPRFAVEVYDVFMINGFSKASGINLFTFAANTLLKRQELDEDLEEALEILSWKLPENEPGNIESVKCLVQLTASPGQSQATRDCANKILARLTRRGTFQNILIAAQEFGRIPLEVLDVEVIKFLDRIVTEAPLGFLPPEAVSKQASEFLIRAIVEGGDDKIKAQAALTFLKWWSKPSVFDPADIFYRLFIHRQQSLIEQARNHSELERSLQSESIAGPIRTIFSQQVKPPRSDTMNKFLSRVDFSKLTNKQIPIDLVDIVSEVITYDYVVIFTGAMYDYVVGLVEAWIWFMDKFTFQKLVSNLGEEMLKKNIHIYKSILASQKFQND